MTSEPYLSIVLCGRNDDHGIRFADRFFAALDFNRRNLLERGIEHEYVFVDWAYDPERELFARMLRREFPWLHRCYAVDPRFQERRRTNPRLAFMEFWAKNVGVRRASGRFILTTNSDVFFADALLSRIASVPLERDRGYRAVRVDIRLEVTCREVSHELLEDPQAASFVNAVLPPYYNYASGDFILLSKELWHRCRGFNENITHSKVHLDGNLCVNLVERFKVPLAVIGKVWHLEHKSSFNLSHHQHGHRGELAPWGPDWDYTQTFENGPDWGLGDVAERVSEDGIRFLDWSGP